MVSIRMDRAEEVEIRANDACSTNSVSAVKEEQGICSDSEMTLLKSQSQSQTRTHTTTPARVIFATGFAAVMGDTFLFFFFFSRAR